MSGDIMQDNIFDSFQKGVRDGLPIALDYGKYPDRAYDSPCIYGDNTKIKRILGL